MSGIILAGGKSERMGGSKADLELGGRRLLEWVAEALREVCGELLVVSPRPLARLPAGTRWVCDEPAGCGPLGGLYAGLNAAREELNFVAACDTPFLRLELIKGLLELAGGWQVVVAKGEDGLHPLCGVYARSCREAIGRALAAGERRVRSFYPQVQVRLVEAGELRGFDPDLVSLININTPEELARAETLVGLLSSR